LAKRKAEATKTTLPPLVEKSSKLLKVNENLTRRKTEAAKVAAAEREKKKIHDPSPVIDLEKKTISKKRVASISEEEKCVVDEENLQTTRGLLRKGRESIRSQRQMTMLISY
jgi:hypothetical protein